MTKVFIDGSAGTTGLRIHERLSARKDLEIITLADDIRKDVEARRTALNSADVAFLCLPDDAAREAVSLIESDVAVIDTSTAHRTDPRFVYGFPELFDLRDRVRSAKRIANPGCHASGFVSLVAPLVAAGILPADASLSCTSLTGYSGGGKKMIAQYEENDRDPLLAAPRLYGLTQQHKHLKEMKAVCGLEKEPLFQPIVAPFYSGMEVMIGLSSDKIKGSVSDICDVYRKTFEKGLVHFVDKADEAGFLSAAAYSGRDDMEISVVGNEDRILLVSRFDNLGKGASGAAIQNMNILLGLDEEEGLDVYGG